MKNLHMACRCLLCALAICLAVARVQAEASAVKGSLVELRRAVNNLSPTPGRDHAEWSRYVDHVELMLLGERPVEAARALTQLKALLPTDSTGALAVIDRLLVNARDQADGATAREEAAYAALLADFLDKVAGDAKAADYDDLYRRLADLAPGSSSAGTTQQNLGLLREQIARWQDYLLQSEQGQFGAAARSLGQLVQDQSRLAILPRSKLVTMQDAFAQRLRPPSAEEELIKDLQARLGALIASADDAADFDDFIVELGRTRQVNSGHAQFRALNRCATHWQSFYAARANGNAEDAGTFLRYFQTDREFDPIFPYDKVRQKLFSTARTEADRAANLLPPGEITLANVMLLEWQVRHRHDRRLPLPFAPQALLRELQNLRMPLMELAMDGADFVLLKSASWDQPLVAEDFGGYADAIVRIRREMLHRAVCLYLNLPDAPVPENQDSFATYANRLLAQSVGRKDWPMVHRLLTAKQQMKVQTAGDAADLIGFGHLIRGLQLERAGLLELADQAYLQAIDSRAPRLPPEEIGERRARLAGQVSPRASLPGGPAAASASSL